jgi:signal peptidase I
MLWQLINILAWLAVPATLIAVVDDWFVRPQRRAAPNARSEPPIVAVVYYVLPVLLVAAVINLLRSERLDFSMLLVLVAAVAGLVWLIDHLLLAPARARAARRAGRDPAAQPVPVTVDYARSFFPVAIIVLVVRSFIFEPFRIPSDSMMPTLLDGDFIIVNKYAYGLRLPVINQKFLRIGEPARGDVMVFRYPPDPSINYIKRVVGLPGDRVRVFNDQLIINGQPVPLRFLRRYDDGCYHNFRLQSEVLGQHPHEVLSCQTPEELSVPPTASCPRQMDRNYECVEPEVPGEPDHGDHGDMIVPPGHYLMIGDNRDNSSDSRYWGFVPEQNIVGKATYIWFNWDLQRSGGPNIHRIGHHIE